MSRILQFLILVLAAPSAGAAPVDCSPAAKELYLEGHSLLGARTARDLRAAIEHFDRPLAADADCAPAFAGRARAHALLYEYQQAREAALGFVRLHADRDRAGAEESLRRAVGLDPEDPTAHHWLAICLEVSDRGEEAVDQFETTLAIEPDLASAHYFLGRARVEQREYDQAMAAYEAAAKLSPGDWNLVSARGYLHARAGRERQALAVAAELEHYIARGYPFRSQVASIYAGLGDKEQALDWLARAVETREGPLLWLAVDPRFDPLRSDPRFPDEVPGMQDGSLD